LVKPILVRAGLNVSRAMYPIFYGFAAFIGLGLIAGLIVGYPTFLLVVFAFLFILFLAAPIPEHIKQVKIKKALKILKAIVIDLEDESKLRLSKPLRLRPIIFRAEASKSWDRGPYYVWSSRIEPRGVYEVRSSYEFADLSYAIVVDKSGVGGAILPGIEFDEPGLRDIVLLYIPSKQPLLDPSYHVLKSPWGQRIEIRIQGGPGVKGEARLSGGGKASVYLVAEYHGTWIKTFFTKKVELPISRQVKIKLATLRSGEIVWFSAKLALDTPILVVAHKKSSPRALAWRLTKPLIAGDMPHYSLEIVIKQGILKKFMDKIGLRVIKQQK